MLDHGRTPSSLTESLCSHSQSRLQMLATRSAALEASSLGVMAFDAAFATIALSVGRTRLWIAVLTPLCMSLALAIVTLELPGAHQNGPSIARMRRRRETEADDQVAEHLLDGLERDLRIDRLALSRKEPLLKLSLALLALAVAVEIAGVIG